MKRIVFGVVFLCCSAYADMIPSLVSVEYVGGYIKPFGYGYLYSYDLSLDSSTRLDPASAVPQFFTMYGDLSASLPTPSGWTVDYGYSPSPTVTFEYTGSAVLQGPAVITGFDFLSLDPNPVPTGFITQSISTSGDAAVVVTGTVPGSGSLIPATVPEPSPAIPVVSGLLMTGALVRRRRNESRS